MKNWKVGDKVLCVDAKGTWGITEGKEYVIDGFTCCADCGDPLVHLRGKNIMIYGFCAICNHKEYWRDCYKKSRFIKPDIESLTAYRSEVSVREISVPKELTELKNLQNT